MGGCYRCSVRGDRQVWRGARWGEAEAWEKRGRKGEKICPFLRVLWLTWELEGSCRGAASHPSACNRREGQGKRGCLRGPAAAGRLWRKQAGISVKHLRGTHGEVGRGKGAGSESRWRHHSGINNCSFSCPFLCPFLRPSERSSRASGGGGMRVS